MSWAQTFLIMSAVWLATGHPIPSLLCVVASVLCFLTAPRRSRYQ